MHITPKSKRELAQIIAAGIAADDRDIVLGTASVSPDAQVLTCLWEKYKANRDAYGTEIRLALARNAGTPAPILEEIYSTAPNDDETIREACLTNQSMPLSYVRAAADSPNAELRKLAARNPGLDEITLLRLSKDRNDDVAHAAFETMRRKCRT